MNLLSFAMEDSDDEQMVFDMGGRPIPPAEGAGGVSATARTEALQKAIKESLKMAADAGVDVSDEKTIADAQARAETMLASGDMQGMVEVRKLMLAQGLPAPRLTFGFMADAAGIKGSVRAKINTKIDNMSPITDKVCVQFDFVDRVTHKPNTAYLLLDECPRDYDYGAALCGFQSRLPPEKAKEVIDRSSMLFNAGRVIYAQIAAANLPLIRKINKLPSDDPCTQFLNLQVDVANTTLFINPGWPKRVGLMIHYSDEMSRSPP